MASLTRTYGRRRRHRQVLLARRPCGSRCRQPDSKPPTADGGRSHRSALREIKSRRRPGGGVVIAKKTDNFQSPSAAVAGASGPAFVNVHSRASAAEDMTSSSGRSAVRKNRRAASPAMRSRKNKWPTCALSNCRRRREPARPPTRSMHKLPPCGPKPANSAAATDGIGATVKRVCDIVATRRHRRAT